LSTNTTYEYTVEAYDPSYNYSGESDSAFATTLDEVFEVNVQVSSGNDDAEEGEDGSIQLASSDLELVEDRRAGSQTVGIRFAGIDIPQGVQVTNAYIEFEADETGTEPAILSITAEESDDAQAFSSAAYDISDRLKMSSSVEWNNIEPWDIVNAKHQTPDISLVVQDIINRGGWVSGNAIAFIITGTGVRTAESYEGERTAAATIHIEYVYPRIIY